MCLLSRQNCLVNLHCLERNAGLAAIFSCNYLIYKVTTLKKTINNYS